MKNTRILSQHDRGLDLLTETHTGSQMAAAVQTQNGSFDFIHP